VSASLWILLAAATAVSGEQPSHQAEPVASQPASIEIRVLGNRLLLFSDNPEALIFATELCRLLAKVRVEEKRIESFRLKHAPAMATAMLLSELCNGPRPTMGTPANNAVNLFASLVGQQPFPPIAAGAARPERVHIVAVSATNSLIVQATPTDLSRIQTMLESGLDSHATGKRETIQTWVLPPLKHGNALNIAEVLREVYREQLYDDTTLPFSLEFTGPAVLELLRGQLVGAVASAARSVRTGNLWITADVPTNRLILACPEKTKSEIEKLVIELDDAAAHAPRVVQVVRVQGVRPEVVQRAMESLQGRRSPNGTRPEYGNGVPGATSQSGGLFGTPGFIPLFPGVGLFGLGTYPPGGNGSPGGVPRRAGR
jgi:hypothetical protein